MQKVKNGKSQQQQKKHHDLEFEAGTLKLLLEIMEQTLRGNAVQRRGVGAESTQTGSVPLAPRIS